MDFGDFGFWGGPGDVPLGNLVTVPGGQRLESPLVRLVSDRVGARKKIELNDYMLHSLELISRCLHACFGYYCNITIQIPNAKPTLSDTVGKG